MTRPMPITVLKSPRFLELSNLSEYVRDGSQLIEGLFENSLFTSVCSLGRIVEPACVFDGDYIAFLRLVNAIAAPDELL